MYYITMGCRLQDAYIFVCFIQKHCAQILKKHRCPWQLAMPSMPSMPNALKSKWLDANPRGRGPYLYDLRTYAHSKQQCSQWTQAKAGTQQTYTFLEVHWALTFVLYTVPGTNARLVDQDCPTQSWNPTTSWKLFFNAVLIDHC